MEKSRKSDKSRDRESTCNLNSAAFRCDLEITLRSLMFCLRDIPQQIRISLSHLVIS